MGAFNQVVDDDLFSFCLNVVLCFCFLRSISSQSLCDYKYCVLLVSKCLHVCLHVYLQLKDIRKTTEEDVLLEDLVQVVFVLNP